MRHEPGNWRVTRFCCTSGLCIDCHDRGNHGDRAKRRRVIQTTGLSETYARWVAGNWVTYEGVAELVPGTASAPQALYPRDPRDLTAAERDQDGANGAE